MLSFSSTHVRNSPFFGKKFLSSKSASSLKTNHKAQEQHSMKQQQAARTDVLYDN